MQRIYVPLSQTMQPAKIIPLHATSILEDWISLEDAAKLFTSARCPNGIRPLTLKTKIWKIKGRRRLPKHCFAWGPAGLRFHKPSLLGLKPVTFLNPAA